MRFRTQWLGLVVMLCATSAAPAQDSLLDLLPEGACAFGVPSMKTLKTKGDKFLKDTEIPMPQRPSEIIEEAFRMLRVDGAVDENLPAVFMIFGPKAVGINANFGNGFEDLSVAIIPIKDVKKLETNFNLKAGQLQPGKIVNVEKQNYGKHLYLKGKHLFIGENAKVITYAAEKAPSIAKRLTANQKKSLVEADMVVHLAFESWGDETWGPIFGNASGLLKGIPDPEERKVMEQFVEASKDVSYVLGAIRLDDGLGINLVAGLKDKSADSSKKLLALLGSGKGVSSLKNLPMERLLAAQGVRGDGKATSMIAKIMLDGLMHPTLEEGQIISAAERPVFVGILKEVWQHLQGSKTGVYINPDAKKQGLFSFLAVLDTENAKEFLKEMKTLAKIAEGKDLDLNRKIDEGGEVDIEKLIADLGSKSYRVRETANLKISLLGEPALPYLAKAQEAKKSLEIVLRAEKLSTQIKQLAADRRRAALSQNPFERIRPTFVMATDVEKRAGHTIDVIRINLTKDEQLAQKQMEEILGPDWNNIRLAVHGEQVVILLGSNLDLFEQTLQNITKDEPGLASSKSLTELYRYSDTSRKFEMHVSIQNVLALSEPGTKQLPGQASPLSSLGLSIEPAQIQLDVWLPVSEVRVMARKAGGF
jgi:hypothetical protein